MFKKNILLVSFLGVLLIPSARAKEFNFPFHQEIPASGITVLKVSNPSGNIKISSHAQNLIVIEAVKKVKARNQKEASQMAESININVKREKNELLLQTEYPKFYDKDFWKRLFSGFRTYSLSVEYEIKVPQKLNLVTTSTSGDLQLYNITGEVTVSTTSGDSYLENIVGKVFLESTSGDMHFLKIEGPIRIDATSADMKLEKIKSDITIDCTSGDLTGNDIKGSLKINTTSGDLILTNIVGDILADVVSGDITIEQNQGGFELSTTSGDIQVKSSLTKSHLPSHKLNTTSGNVNLSLTAPPSGELEVHTHSGTIYTRIPLTVESISRTKLIGRFDSQKGKIYINTSSGDITLTQL